LKGNYNMMLTTQNITSRTLQSFCHMKYTNLCNKKREPNHQHQGIYVTTLALGSRPRQKGLQGCGLRGSPGVKPRGSSEVKVRRNLGVKARKSSGVTSHIPGSVCKKYEGV